MDFEVRLLGRFSIKHGADEIPATAYEGRQVRVLLRALASRQGVFTPRDTLVDALWADRAPAEPERNLNVMIARREAENAFMECIGQAQGLPMFMSMGAAHLALLKVAQGKLNEASMWVEQAAAGAPPFSQFEVRLAQSELAAALNDPNAAAVAAEALKIAINEGHQVSIARLSELAGVPAQLQA